MIGSTNRAILKLNSNELHFVRHNIDLKKTGSFPNSQEANFFKSLIIGNFKNPLVSREQLNIKTGATDE